MTKTSIPSDMQQIRSQIESAANDGLLSSGAVENLKLWLSDDRYASYTQGIVEHIAAGKWQQLDDVFWTVIPFGTGGRRGMMYPFGSNAINERTIGESAQGLATYVRNTKPDGPWSCAIAYDTRHRSREFAELCAGIMVANGFTVFFIDDYRSTPELSFLIRYKQCDCGIMVTASHNPPSDNAVKVYWSDGAQLIPPHDHNVIEQVMQVGKFDVTDFDVAVADSRIKICTQETDKALLDEHVKQSYAGARDLNIIYSPLHGVGETNVRTLLQQVGFANVEIYEPHRTPDGDFPNVPGHVSNPENPKIFEEIIVHAQQAGADLILATDPDCDRMGAAAPLTVDCKGPWKNLDGNQLGALLTDFVLNSRRQAGQASPDDYIVSTLVTSRMSQRIAQSYGVSCYQDNLVGFKWICSKIDQVGPENFAFGFEESHGYLVGTYARDKDGAVACMLMCELAAKCKNQRISVHEKLNELFVKHGYHCERLSTIRMEGSDGMRRMQQLMDRLRSKPPTEIGGLQVAAVSDYQTHERRNNDGSIEKVDGPTGNLIFLETEIPGNYVAVRPSGTEPKVKMYMFTYVAPQQIEDLHDTKREMDLRLDAFDRDIRSFAEQTGN